MRPCEKVAEDILRDLHRLHGDRWLSSPRKPVNKTGSSSPDWLETHFGFRLTNRQRQRLHGIENLQDLFSKFYFRGIVLDSHEGLVGWMEERYPLIHLTHVPTPLEMLDIQCLGQRFITQFTEAADQLRPRGRFDGAVAFTLHDLEHAHKFFGCPLSFAGQVRFFRGLQAALPYLARWNQDEKFNYDLHYLMADMNSHPLHLLKYLKAILLAAEIRRTRDRHPNLSPIFAELWLHWSFVPEVAVAADRINQPGLETEADHLRITEFFCPTPLEVL